MLLSIAILFSFTAITGECFKCFFHNQLHSKLNELIAASAEPLSEGSKSNRVLRWAFMSVSFSLFLRKQAANEWFGVKWSSGSLGSRYEFSASTLASRGVKDRNTPGSTMETPRKASAALLVLKFLVLDFWGGWGGGDLSVPRIFSLPINKIDIFSSLKAVHAADCRLPLTVKTSESHAQALLCLKL